MVSPHTGQMATGKTLQRINVGDGVDKKEPSSTDAGNVN